jgi:hypothetical protein
MKSTNVSSAPAWLMALLAAVCLAACGGGGGGSGGATAGTVSVSMTDAPACGFDEVNVTVRKVRIHQSDSVDEGAAGWTDITLNPPQKINLLSLNDPTQPNFALATLGQAPLAAGHYTQLRLLLAENSNNPNSPMANSLVLSGQTTEIPLVTPSGIQSGIKLIHQFTVNSGERVDLLLDFDACKSIVERSNGTYALKPVIHVIPYTLNGIEGFLDTVLFVNQLNVNNVVVSAQVNGEIVRAVVPNAVSGKFFLAHLPAPASYDVVIAGDNHATAVISGVQIADSTSIAAVSADGAPISLNGSATNDITGTVTLNPAEDDGTVVVAAKQSLVGGPTVTVKSQVSTVLVNTLQSGDYQYEVTLPTGAPSLGQFSLILPITLTDAAQSTVAGIYTAHGSGQTSTTAYAVQIPAPSPVNITGGNADHSFTLTP